MLKKMWLAILWGLLVSVLVVALAMVGTARVQAAPGTIRELAPPHAPASTPQKWLVYNIALGLPLYVQLGNKVRVPQLLTFFADEDADVIVLIEAFDQGSREMLLDGLRQQGYTQWIGGCDSKIVHNGIYIGAKQKIEFVDQMIFQEAVSSDIFSAKGAILCRVGDQYLAAIHMQSWESKIHWDIRHAQMKSLMKWLEPYPNTIVCGDFNVDPDSHEMSRWEGDFRYQILPKMGSLKDYATSDLLGIDGECMLYVCLSISIDSLFMQTGTAMDYSCETDFYSNVCWSVEKPGLCTLGSRKDQHRSRRNCECCPAYQLVWALRTGEDPLPTGWHIETVNAKAKEEMQFGMWRIGWLVSPEIRTRDLSDHLPVRITLA